MITNIIQQKNGAFNKPTIDLPKAPKNPAKNPPKQGYATTLISTPLMPSLIVFEKPFLALA